jgi:hypothetical protein
MKKVVEFVVAAYGELNILAVCHGYNAPKGILSRAWRMAENNGCRPKERLCGMQNSGLSRWWPRTRAVR